MLLLLLSLLIDSTFVYLMSIAGWLALVAAEVVVVVVVDGFIININIHEN